MLRFSSDLDQALAFLSSFVTVTKAQEIASQPSYFVPLSSSLDWEEEQGRWMQAQQLQSFAASLGFSPSR